MSATKTRLQKPKSYEAKIAKSRSILKNLRKKQHTFDPYSENTNK